MPETSDRIYAYAPLDGYTFLQRTAIRAAGLVFYILIWFVGRTTTFEVEGSEHLERGSSNDIPPIYAVWHDRIFLGTYYLRGSGIVFLTSQSFDGEYIARFLQRFGFGVVRGSSTRGGARGLAAMIRGVRKGLSMGFTVDGPKGPRYVAKSGAVLLARKTGSPIIPFIVEPSRYWTVNSWDRLQIPRPFGRAKVIVGKPLVVDDKSSEKALEEALAELQGSLERLVKRGREWRESI